MQSFKSCIRPHGGLPTLFVNGKPVFLNAPYPKGEAPYKDGTPITNPISSPIYCIRSSLGMRLDGTADITEAVDVITRFLAWKPDALFIMRTIPRAPMAWLDANPSEEMLFDKPITHLPGYEEYRDASMGSEKWVSDICRTYASFCGQLHEKYGGRVIGYQFGGGSQGENNPMGNCTNDSRWFCVDFSETMTRTFRRWLEKKYGTVAALRQAWSDPEVTFETAKVPDRQERMRSEWFTFRSPLRSQSPDFYACWAERTEDLVIAICSSIKEATRHECIAGSHLGTFLDQGLHAYILHQTTSACFARALRHPAVDTFTSPCSYVNKGPGGDCTSMIPIGSLQLHGKLRLQDQDTLMSTAFSPEEMSHEAEMLYYAYYRLPKNISESVELLKRDLGHMIIRGYGCWWHAMRPGMYDQPELVNAIGRLQEIARVSLDLPRGMRASMAVVADERSSLYQQCANRLVYPMIYHQRQHFWSRTGAGWDAYVHSDLDHPAMPDYPVYLFLNTFYLTDEDMDRIERKVKKNRATVIWTYAPGIQSPSGFDLERVRRLTGFRLKSADFEALPRVTVTDYSHPYTQGLGNGTQSHGSAFSFGTLSHLGNSNISTNDEREGMMGPMIYVDDPDAVVLGELDCLREPGFCVKEMDGWTSVYLSAPMANTRILSNIIRTSGGHLYSEDEEVICPGKSFIMMHTSREGEKTIRLPEPADVYDCWNDRVVGRGISVITAAMPAKGTALYYLGDLDKWADLVKGGKSSEANPQAL